MDEKKESFTYTYSAAQQEEIDAIRRKYAPDTQSSELDKMTELRRLDTTVTSKATTVSLCVGIISALVMGFGMSLIMTDLGDKLNIAQPLFPGMTIGIAGMLGVIAAYPIYQAVLKRERKKAAPKILKLTEELSQQ